MTRTRGPWATLEPHSGLRPVAAGTVDPQSTAAGDRALPETRMNLGRQPCQHPTAALGDSEQPAN